MDLFYTAEWMARQEQDHSLTMQKKLKLKPVEEDGTVFKMFDGDTEKVLIELHNRNPDFDYAIQSAPFPYPHQTF